jgi:hypothetical protein
MSWYQAGERMEGCFFLVHNFVLSLLAKPHYSLHSSVGYEAYTSCKLHLDCSGSRRLVGQEGRSLAAEQMLSPAPVGRTKQAAS